MAVDDPMTYSSEDVERIAAIAVKTAVIRIGAGLPAKPVLQSFVDECVHTGLNDFWDEELSEKSETVTYTINGKQFEGVAGTLLTFNYLAALAGVKNADTCVFKRKRARARDGLLEHTETLKLQGGMAITIVNTGSA